jgi:hypothetical protein
LRHLSSDWIFETGNRQCYLPETATSKV